MKIAVIGTGYVGLVSGTCFAEFGHSVTCIDVDAAKVDLLRAGCVPIYEPGLADMLERNIATGLIGFTTDIAQPVSEADVVFLAVGTPMRRGDGHADLTFVEQAARQVARSLAGYTVIVTKSTVPVGTNHRIAAWIREEAPDADFDVASNPEFLREGAAIDDFMCPDRVVVGCDSGRAAQVLARVYSDVVARGYDLMVTDIVSAEMIKYAANAFLATKITFINQIADLCEKTGGNIRDVARGVGMDTRIGPKFLNAGPGYGGSCFPKDTNALTRIGEDAGVDLSIVRAVVSANESRKRRMADRIIEAVPGGIQGHRIAILGATFKPETDDMRDAPSLSIVPRLLELGAQVAICDPQGSKEGIHLLPGAIWEDDPLWAALGASVVVVLTEWPMFAELDLSDLACRMASPIMVDMRNLFIDQDPLAKGFVSYIPIGKPREASRA